MKLATELSYSNAVLFARSPMKFLALDEISFSLPVPIGAILRLTATVIHSTSHALHSQVTAELVDVRSGKKSKTNTFYLTWGKEGRALAREVQPVSLTEGMAWLEGRRRLEQGSKLRSVTGA
jgi:acyl-coenzyme A thioesterase 9